MFCVQADKLLSQEFQPVIEQLIGLLPADRQIMLFSATFPVTVKQFKDKFLRKPYIVNLMSELTLKGISQVSPILSGHPSFRQFCSIFVQPQVSEAMHTHVWRQHNCRSGKADQAACSCFRSQSLCTYFAVVVVNDDKTGGCSTCSAKDCVILH